MSKTLEDQDFPDDIARLSHSHRDIQEKKPTSNHSRKDLHENQQHQNQGNEDQHKI